ncbi:MAG: HAD-IC family P-type ATPase, partial [Candidatus Paceibacterota bacterium]
MKQNWHTLSVNEVIEKFGSDPHSGLSEEEAKKHQQKFGLNKLPEEKPRSGFGLLLEQFRSFLIYILVVAGIVSLFLRDYTDAIVIFGSVFLSVFIGFYQEKKTSNILHALKKIVQVKALVLRDGNEKEVRQSELVPGDILFLEPGSKVPADGRLIENFDLKVNESVFTGEWLASDKGTGVLPEKTSLADRDNMVYMGCVVESGRGKAVVTETGLKTELGKLAELIRETEEGKTPYQIKINHLSRIIGIAVIAGCILIFGLGILMKKGALEMFLTSVAAAVGAIPEGLTVAITVILTLGMQRILKKQGLVRKMAAAETLGNTSIICTDKTGTLTLAQMQIAGIFTEDKELLSDGKKFTETIDKNGSEAHILALKIGMLCTEAFIENPEDELHKWIIRGRPMERALLLAGIQAGFSKKELEEHQPKIDEIFFDPVYKYSATLHHYSDKANVLYILGAPEIILKMS